MKTMQARQACKRIDQITGQKRDEIRRKYSVKKLTYSEKLDLFLANKVVLKDEFYESVKEYEDKIARRKENYFISPPNSCIFSIFDYSPFEDEGIFKPGYEEALKRLENHAEKVKDDIWFGDSAEALEALRALQDMKF